MKRLLFLIVFIYLYYRAVYGAKQESNIITIEPVAYAEEGYLEAGQSITINCKGTSKNQKLEWLDPKGNAVKRLPGNRIHVLENFSQVTRGGRIPSLELKINNALRSDTGIYQCRSGLNIQETELCVIETSEFVDTPLEVTTDLGRSITLSCQAKGVPEPCLQWIRNGEVITDVNSSSKYRVMTKFNSQGFEGLLTIMSLRPEDSGVYSCESKQISTIIKSCVATRMANITLKVSYAPIFENDNDTTLVYGKNGQEVNLVCSAGAFPAPEYRWFQDLGNTMSEYDPKQIIITEDDEAVLTVTATPSTFGQRYKCVASNEKGNAEKSFVLLKMDKPYKPNKVNYYNSNDSMIQLNVVWNENFNFPVDGFDVQYLTVLKNKPKNEPREAEWRKGIIIKVELNEEEQDVNSTGMIVTVPELQEETEYWIRLRATNSAGSSSWSPTISASTVAKLEISEPPEPEMTSRPKPDYSDATIYGIFFAGGIFVVAAVCMFAMRIV